MIRVHSEQGDETMRIVRMFSMALVAVWLLSACGVGLQPSPEAARELTDADIEATVQARLAAAQSNAPTASLANDADPAATATRDTENPAAAETLPTMQPSSATETVPTPVASNPEANPCPSVPAQSSSGGDTQPVASAALAPPAMLLILDSSGSMQIDDGTGRPKIDAAKDALNQLVDALPDGAPVGLMVYGHRVPNTDKANGCQDVELIAPIAPLDKSDMKDKIASFRAVGFTPISTALEQAAAALPPEGERTIILVSDGEETCDRDPCQIIKDLLASGIDVTVETVGFQVDAKTRSQLECIAEATGGAYHDAKDAATLAGTLKQLSTRALKTYQTVGNAVSGGDSFNNPAALAPGQYTDTIKNNETLYYAVTLGEGQRLSFSATIVGQDDIGVIDDAGANSQLEIFAPDRTSLGSQYGSYGSQTGTVVLTTKPAPATGRYFVSLRADDYTKAMDGREFQTELLVEILGENGENPCVGEGSVASQQPVAPGPVQGGGSFNTAPLIQGGQYTDTIKNNETLYYAVTLGEGQRLSFSATIVGQDDIGVIDDAGANSQLEIFAPDRTSLGSQYGSYGSQTGTVVLTTKPAPATGRYFVSLRADDYTKAMDGREFQTELVIAIQ
jgi:Ca-activated chloride channel homolog